MNNSNFGVGKKYRIHSAFTPMEWSHEVTGERCAECEREDSARGGYATVTNVCKEHGHITLGDSEPDPDRHVCDASCTETNCPCLTIYEVICGICKKSMMSDEVCGCDE